MKYFIIFIWICSLTMLSAAPIDQQGHLILRPDSTTFTFPNSTTTDTIMFVFDDGKGAFRGGLDSKYYGNWISSATGDYSLGYGYEPKASGVASVALGSMTVATGSYSFAVGSISEALGFGAVAMGAASKAMGDHAVALGWGAEAPAQMVAVGRWNLMPSSQNFGLGTEYPVFVVGSGYPGEMEYIRRNALEVYDKGSVRVFGNLNVNGALSASTINSSGGDLKVSKQLTLLRSSDQPNVEGGQLMLQGDLGSSSWYLDVYEGSVRFFNENSLVGNPFYIDDEGAIYLGEYNSSKRPPSSVVVNGRMQVSEITGDLRILDSLTVEGELYLAQPAGGISMGVFTAN